MKISSHFRLIISFSIFFAFLVTCQQSLANEQMRCSPPNLGKPILLSKNQIKQFIPIPAVPLFQHDMRLAKLGCPHNQYEIAEDYAYGMGTVQDRTRAYAWVTIVLLQNVGNNEFRISATKLQNSLTQELHQQDIRNRYLYGETNHSLANARALAKQYYKLYVLHDSSSKD